MQECACGCGQWFERERRKGSPIRYLPGHQFRTAEAQVAFRAGKTRQRRQPPPDYPTHGLCLCGCGQKTTIAQTSNRTRRWYAGYPLLYVHGHSRRGKPHPNPRPKPERIYEKGYVFVYRPDHPNAPKDGYVLEHRLVWEATHGRLLTPTMSVHHINGIRDDNRPENLVALSRSEHQRLHKSESKPVTEETRRKLSAAAKQSWDARRTTQQQEN